MKHRKNLFAISICLRIYWMNGGKLLHSCGKRM